MKKKLFILGAISALGLTGCAENGSSGRSLSYKDNSEFCSNARYLAALNHLLNESYRKQFPECFVTGRFTTEKDFLNTQVNFNDIVGKYEIKSINVLGNNNTEDNTASNPIGTATIDKKDSKFVLNINFEYNNVQQPSDLYYELNNFVGKSVELEINTNDFKQINENEIIISKKDNDTNSDKVIGSFNNKKELILMSDIFNENNQSKQNFYFQLLKK